ncbi:MAG: hypothetical protein JNK77_09985 [Saprospiraceae bacterium]|nr:hypothetical protein [Saprospiraceae bacterium]
MNILPQYKTSTRLFGAILLLVAAGCSSKETTFDLSKNPECIYLADFNGNKATLLGVKIGDSKTKIPKETITKETPSGWLFCKGGEGFYVQRGIIEKLQLPWSYLLKANLNSEDNITRKLGAPQYFFKMPSTLNHIDGNIKHFCYPRNDIYLNWLEDFKLQASTMLIERNMNHENHLDIIEEYESVTTIVRKGLDLFLAGSYEASITKFKEALAIQPNNNTARFLIGRSYFYLEENDNAAIQLHHVIDVAPDSYEAAEAHLLMAKIYKKEGFFDQALSAAQKVVLLNYDEYTVGKANDIIEEITKNKRTRITEEYIAKSLTDVHAKFSLQKKKEIYLTIRIASIVEDIIADENKKYFHSKDYEYSFSVVESLFGKEALLISTYILSEGDSSGWREELDTPSIKFKLATAMAIADSKQRMPTPEEIYSILK